MGKEQDLTAADMMTSDVATAVPGLPLRQVVVLMAVRHVSGLPVVDADGTLLGMITEGDLMRWLDSRQAAALQDLPPGQHVAPELMNALGDASLTVADIMPPGPAVTVTEESRLDDIARLMHAHGVKRFPVTRNGRLVGIISRSDLLRGITFALEDADEALRISRTG